MYLYDTYKCLKKHKYKWYIYESHDLLSSIQSPLPSLFFSSGTLEWINKNESEKGKEKWKKNRFILFFLLLGKILFKDTFDTTTTP